METGLAIRILIIDDDRVDREIYKAYLRSCESRTFEFTEADLAASGIELARGWAPDCILLDFNLPDSDGMEVMRRIAGEGDRLPCAVILLTAYGDEDLAVRAMKAGAMDYLPKDRVAAGKLDRTVLHAVERFQMRQRIAEQATALEQSARRYKVLLESLPLMVWTANADGRVEYANRRWLDYTGLGVEAGEAPCGDGIVHPEDGERTRNAWNQAVRSGSAFEIEHRLRRAPDGSYRWHLVRAVPMHSVDGVMTGWLGTCTEIEDQKRAERVARQEHKLAGIGVLAGGMAHDFNNLLMCILGGASSTIDLLPEKHPAQEMQKTVIRAGERAAELTRKMLTFAGKANFSLELTDADRLVRETCDALRPTIPTTIDLTYHGTSGIPPVRTDAAQLRQVVLELLMNAIESIGEGACGRVSVRTNAMGIDGTTARRGPRRGAIPSGKYVVVEVRDTGAGMDQETQERIFDPFFSTKFMGRGMGLAAVHGFVRTSGGDVQVESAPGKGARFQILLPAAGVQAAAGGIGG